MGCSVIQAGRRAANTAEHGKVEATMAEIQQQIWQKRSKYGTETDRAVVVMMLTPICMVCRAKVSQVSGRKNGSSL